MIGSLASLDDPYAELAGWRERGPMLREPESGRYLATTHAAVSQVLRDRRLGRLWSDHEPAEVMEPFNALHRHQLMENEPPEHTRMRRLLAGAFGRGHVERLRPRIESLADGLLDGLAVARGPVDLLGGYAEPLPVLVIADLLGVPRADHERLRDWSQAIVAMYEPAPALAAEAARVRESAVQAAAEFAAYVRDVLDERRRHPGDDLISHLLAERHEGVGLTEPELVATVVLLLNAGHEASVNAFGNGMLALLQHPDQWARLVDGEVDPALALEELLRFDAPLQLFERTAIADVEIAGTLVRAGETVACLMGSANRDPVVFAAPDQLDVGRDPNPHVGFGLGLHFCLGAPLARLELAITLAAVLRRYPHLSLAEPGPARRPTWVLRGLQDLPVHLEGS